jgi:integral membrane protein
MQSKKSFSTFRKIALLEGLSFLILLFIAMPLKYMMGMPLAVRVVGSLHGALFVAYIIYMYLVYNDFNKNFRWMLKAFVASIIPFGTMWMDKEWKQEELAV